MKKVLSIFLSFLMIAAGLHFSVATHYCGGKLAASKVSITGKLADCGMEDMGKEVPLSGTNFSNHCCDNIVVSCSTDNNYVPSFFNVQDAYQHVFKILNLPVGNTFSFINPLKSHHTNADPPGTMKYTDVDLSDICVFRI